MTRRIYLDFDLHISPHKGAYRAHLLASPAGQAVEEFTLPFIRDVFDTTVEHLLSGEEGISSATDLLAAKQFGVSLYQAIFRGNVLACLERSLVEARNQDAGLRIRLRLDEARELVILPWELLFHPSLDRFFALSSETPLIHYVELPTKASTLAASLPLKVLVIVASPNDLPLLDAEKEWNNVLGAFSSLIDQDYVTVERLNTARLNELQGALRRGGYHVLHYIGHGALDALGAEGTLLFCDILGKSHPVTAQELAIVIGDVPSLRLVVLNACETGRMSSVPAFTGTAQTLVQYGVPAVVAMQSVISDLGAVAFAREFYAALADGLAVDAAVTEARKAMYSELSGNAWAIPRIVTHAQDGRLWQLDRYSLKIPGRLGLTDTQALDTGLGALVSLLQSTAVRRTVVAFRTDFVAASQQVNLLGIYKDLHDLLHNFEFLCYAGILREVGRFPDDEVAVTILRDHLLTFRDLVDSLQEIVANPILPTSETTWTRELVEAQHGLQHAVDSLSSTGLTQVVRQIKRVLDRYPTRVNERLNAAARSLRLDTIAHGLLSIRSELNQLDLDREKIQQFAAGGEALVALHHRLTSQVEDHDHWQALDLELRRVESLMAYNLDEVLESWPDIKAISERVLGSTTAPWAAELRTEGDRLNNALVDNNPVKIKLHFQCYRRYVGNRFYKVDTELKRLCDDLRSVGEPLAAILDILG